MALQKNLKMPSYGGQALIEGVLMRGKNHLSAAMRSPKNKVVIKTERLEGIYQNSFFRLPLIRGLTIIWDSLVLGMKYMTISANLQSKEDEKIEGASLYLIVSISIFLGVGIFFLLPLLITNFISHWINLNTLGLNIFEGLLRILLIILYLLLISRNRDIKRIYSYHGAEHKTINAYEDSAELNIKSVMRYPTAHPRCGTSFLLTLIVLSIFIFSLIGDIPILIKLLSRIVLVPIFVMFSYEIIRWMGNHLDNSFIRFLSKPNLLLQKLTTREPTPDMVEVAIAAFQSLQKLENS